MLYVIWFLMAYFYIGLFLLPFGLGIIARKQQYNIRKFISVVGVGIVLGPVVAIMEYALNWPSHLLPVPTEVITIGYPSLGYVAFVWGMCLRKRIVDVTLPMPRPPVPKNTK